MPVLCIWQRRLRATHPVAAPAGILSDHGGISQEAPPHTRTTQIKNCSNNCPKDVSEFFNDVDVNSFITIVVNSRPGALDYDTLSEMKRQITETTSGDGVDVETYSGTDTAELTDFQKEYADATMTLCKFLEEDGKKDEATDII